MSSSGKLETAKLKENLENQLERLVQQLDDLESCKDELDSCEYEETKQQTIEQLKEFQESLPRIAKGDVSLVSSVSAIQIATQEAISKAFNTPEVIRLFGKVNPKELRERLDSIDQDVKLGKCAKESVNRKKVEILTALRQAGDKLSQAELKFLHENSMGPTTNFEFEEVKEDD